MIVGHSRDETFYKRSIESYNVTPILIFTQRRQGIGSTGRIESSERAGKPVISHVLNLSRIRRPYFLDRLMQRPGVSSRIKFYSSPNNFCLNVSRLDCQSAIESDPLLIITP